MKWVLLVTWLVPPQQPNSYQVQFGTAGLCNEAEIAMLCCDEFMNGAYSDLYKI